MTRYRQPDPPHRSAWRTAGAILGWFVVCLLVLAAGLGGGVYIWVHNSIAATAPKTPGVIAAEHQLKLVDPSKPATALLIGYDHRTGERGVASRSDTIMLIRTDPDGHTLSMLSFPRDLIVNIYCPGHITYQDRINAAYSVCGPKGTLDTVRHLTGLDVNYLVTVNFRGFEQVVDRLGGVWIDVDRRYFNDNAGLGLGSTFATINLQPGYQKLRGSTALDYVRYRHTDSDVYRVARQQQFVKAAKLQLARFSLFHLPTLINAVTSNTEIAKAGGGGIDFKTLKKFAFFLHNLPPGHFFQPKLQNLQPAGPQGYEFSVAQSSIDDAVQQFLHPDVEESSAATSVALGEKVKRAKSVKPSSVTITVLNGNGVTGSATRAAYLLQKKAYQIVPPTSASAANAPNWNYNHTMVYFNPAVGGTKKAADQVAKQFGTADSDRITRGLLKYSNGAQQTVVVGQTFHGQLAPPPSSHVPKREAPQVRTDPGATLALLKPLRKRVPFPLVLPSVLEKHSNPDAGYGETPVRVYKMNKDHKAVRLVYRLGPAGEYWGVEMTDWPDAPVLSGPNDDVRIKGRHYNLYYSGSNLHMVVLRTHGATYWVVNTLTDALSRDTMLAIAKGLHPLAR